MITIIGFHVLALGPFFADAGGGPKPIPKDVEVLTCRSECAIESLNATGEKMKLYIAGGSDERLTVIRPIIEQVKECGIEITYDWTRSPGYESRLSVVETLEQAKMDLAAVQAADLIWIVAPEAKSEGCATELGAALILGKTVFVSGPHAIRDSRIFYLLATKWFSSHAAAHRAVIDYAQRFAYRAAVALADHEREF